MADEGITGPAPTGPPTDWPVSAPPDPVAPPARRRRRWPWLAGVATLVVIGVGAGITVVLLDDGDSDEAYCRALDTRARDDVPFIAFLEPSVTDDAIARIEEVVEGLAEVADIEFVDQDRAYEEALELFANDPTTLEHLRPQDVPPSFRFTVPYGSLAIDAERALRPLDGVYEVERPEYFVGRTALEVAALIGEGALDGDLGRYGRWIAPDLGDELRSEAPSEIRDDVETLVDALTADDPAVEERHVDAAEAIVDDARTRCEERRPGG